MNLANTDLVAVQSALQNPETLATTIHAIMRAQYGEEAYLWDPASTYLELKADFGVDPESAVIDRFAAMSVVMLSDTFFKVPSAFINICNTLSNGQPFFEVFDPVEVEEAAWAITEVALNRELLPFGYPVRKYIRIMLADAGYKQQDDFPEIFSEALEASPSSADVKKSLTNPVGREVLDQYILEQVQTVFKQLEEIPGLHDAAAEILSDKQYPDINT